MTTLAKLAPVVHGPTWTRGPDGFVVPQYSLGWQACDWAEEWLMHPERQDDPWQFTDEQRRFMVHWYATDDEGRFLYRYGVLRRVKGWGKDPIAAVISCIELIGPCQYAGDFWTDGPYAGQPRGTDRPSAWIKVAATSQAQTQNTMRLFPGLLKAAKADGRFGLDIAKEINYAYGSERQIESITSNPRSAEGGRPTFQIKNETQHWRRQNEGLEMARVMARNAAKLDTRILAITNAHDPSEESDAERDYEAWIKLVQEGKAEGSDILYDSLEAPESVGPQDEDGALYAGIDCARGDSRWLNIERLIAEIRDPRADEAESRRFYLNQIWASEERAFDVEQWIRLAAPDHPRPPKGARVTFGFDGSKSHDHTPLVGTEIATGYQWIAGYWLPSLNNATGEIEVDVSAVMQAFEGLMDFYDVWRVYFDPFGWREQLDYLRGRYNGGKRGAVVVGFDTTLLKRMSVALLDYRAAMDEGALSHDGDPRFTAAIRNARKKTQAYVDDDGEPMYTIQKESPQSADKIDAAMAGALSWRARLDAIGDGALAPEPGLQIFIPGAKEA